MYPLSDVGIGGRSCSLEADDVDGGDSDVEYDGVYAQAFFRF